ncbi:hypothetical protein A3B60_03025 [Candidatus Peregrinibacteria bacterium RIFCSPLOWO2_01_FULL_39_12]|nr:MAG: hypothetical protein A3B60_03025 [Candidatus Peregrinibacteria bacterium RIFCSPLOWO2_01_FULL_39_12]
MLYCIQYLALFFMVRTQLYLPDNLYSLAKEEAEKNKTTFANVVRISLEKTLVSKPYMSLDELKAKFPILKFAGIIKGESGDINNDKIDDFLYGDEQKK